MAINTNDLLGMLKAGNVPFSMTIDNVPCAGVRVATSRWDNSANGKWTLVHGETVHLVHTSHLAAISLSNAPSGNREQADFLKELEFEPPKKTED